MYNLFNALIIINKINNNKLKTIILKFKLLNQNKKNKITKYIK